MEKLNKCNILPAKYANYFKLVSYSRIIQLWPRLILAFANPDSQLKAEQTGVYFIDSTKFQICHNKRTSIVISVVLIQLK